MPGEMLMGSSTHPPGVHKTLISRRQAANFHADLAGTEELMVAIFKKRGILIQFISVGERIPYRRDDIRKRAACTWRDDFS